MTARQNHGKNHLNEQPIRLLALDDQPAMLQAYRWVFGSPQVWDNAPAQGSGDNQELAHPAASTTPFELSTVECGADAVAVVRQARAEGRAYSVFFFEPCLARGDDAVAAAESIREADPDINIVVVAQASQLQPERFAHRIRPPDKLLYFPKPFQPHVLRHLATTLAAKWRAERQLQESHKQLEHLVAERTQELARVNEQLLRDIARRKKVEEALTESEERYALAARAANDALWDWDIPLGQIYLSERWYLMLGLEPKDGLATPDVWFERVHPDERQSLRVAIQKHIERGDGQFEFEFRLRSAQGSYRWILCVGLLVRKKQGGTLRFVGSMSDITVRKEAEERLVHEALHDALTGLPNRALFMERLQHAINVVRRDPDLHFALIFLDLDNFKVVNDSMGHWAGDELLKAVARRIERCMRGTDMLARFGMEKSLARFGGDEFTILLLGIREEEDAARVTLRILRELDRPFHFRGQEVYSTASAGIVFVDHECEDPSSLLRNADIAMYRAKAEGRGGYAIFDQQMHERAVARLDLETALRQAVQREQLELYYQPVVDLGNCNIIGFEALVRWNHPKRGLVAPNDFIPLAEETGLINPIGGWVLMEACEQMAAWKRAFPRRDLFVAVNISSRQFAQQELASQVRATLADANLAPQHLKLEITESVLLENDEAFRSTLEELNSLGVALHMDDFGTGYSSLSYLHRFPFESLKIDRSFVSNMAGDSRSFELVFSIIELARALGMQTTAEGVENEQQLQWLREHRCEHAQGYLFSPPVNATEAGELIHRVPCWS